MAEDQEVQTSAYERVSQFLVRNILPVILIPTLAVGVSAIIGWNDIIRDVKEIHNWQEEHEQYHVDRVRETREEAGAQRAAMEAANTRIAEVVQRADALAFQTAANTRSIEVIQQQQDALTSTLNQLNTRVEVALEILNRLDNRNGPSR